MNKAAPRVLPEDEHNQELVRNAHPADWVAPTPADRYNMVVIGGGTAGLIAALGTAGLGGKVALVEKHLLGGDCLNFGCVPSKGVIAAAHVAHVVRAGGGQPRPFADVMETMRAARAHISHHDSAERLRNDGVDVFLGEARFTGRNTVAVGDTELTFSRCCIATGARALVPRGVPGLDEVGFRTNEDIFELTELPRRLFVVGAGPIGCELAQAFARLGSKVTLADKLDFILPVEEPEARALITAVFREEGIDVITGLAVEKFSRDGDDKVVHLEGGDEVRVDEILLSIGRAPNVDGLDLEQAGVEYDNTGVKVDSWLRTTNHDVYASGDVASRYKFTHAADAMSRIVIQNALFFGRKRVEDLVIPWATYTDPEVAHVGISGEEAAERSDVNTWYEEIGNNDRSLLEGETRGYVRIHTDANGQILGATVVGRHAGELIAPISLAMARKMSLGTFNDAILPYPTRTEVLKHVAGQYNRTRLTPFVANVLRTILRWRR